MRRAIILLPVEINPMLQAMLLLPVQKAVL